MKKSCLILAAVWLVLSTTGVRADNKDDDKGPSKDVKKAGEIRGAVQCTSGTPAAGAWVYIPGESFVAKTDDIGEFILHYVPPGTYELIIEAAGQVSNPIPVQVSKQTVTNLGVLPVRCAPVCTPTLEICDGRDNNCDGQTDEGLGSATCGVGACQRTVQNCVGGTPQTCTPGTSGPETCDNIDNDCDGQVDEGGVCGVTCQPGFANCDGNLSNGCEVFLLTNFTNCGACGNVCLFGQACTAGVCA